jgi:low affinity Fe/Cu permease
MMTYGGVMDTNDIIKQIDTQISSLQEARAILIGIETKKGPGRSKSTQPQVTKPKKRKLSAKGRAAISAAMKARWAKKRATKAVTKKAATKSKS